MEKIIIEGSIVGHASPRWQNPNADDTAFLNQKLSEERAMEVEIFVREIFKREFFQRGIDLDFALFCSNEHDLNSIFIPTSGVGDSVTLEEAGGDINNNSRDLRRVEVNLVMVRQETGEAGMTVAVEIPEECEDNATRSWAVRLNISGSGGHLGVGAAFAVGEIKNLKTNQKVQGCFSGGGIGLGFQTPGADPGWGKWVEFKTEQKVTFQHLDKTLARLTMAGFGVGKIGFGLAYLSFPLYGANSISVGGFNMGAVGADASSNVGVWKFFGLAPVQRCIPAELLPAEEFVPFNFKVWESLKHSIFFETGSSEVINSELTELEKFVMKSVELIEEEN